MNNPLNPGLYTRLQDCFGAVGVSNQGERRGVQYRPDPRRPGKLIAYCPDGQRGEQYRINCPFCGDRRQRCYVSHDFGVVDPRTRQRNDRLWYCFNEQCHEDPANRKMLVSIIGEFPRQRRHRAAPSQTADDSTSSPQPTPPVLIPHAVTPINQLPPDHPAAAYLVQRGFDLQYLGSTWWVHYCDDGHNCRPDPTGRIWFPIWMPRISLSAGNDNAEIVSWQARAIPGINYNTPAKYLFPSGIAKSRMLYGLNLAMQADGPVVVVEGPTDAWRYGPGAVALFGKWPSAIQRQLIRSQFQGRPIVIMLDADAQGEAQLIQQQLATVRPGVTDRHVVIGQLPPGRDDPGECTREELLAAIDQALEGVTA